MTPTVFEYHDYRVFLADALRIIKERRPVFTYRHVAAKVDMRSPGHITWIIQGKRNLSESKIPLFCQVLGLNPAESAFFTELVHFNQARTHVEKKQYLDRLVVLQDPARSVIPPASYELYEHWYYPVVRELVAVYDLDDDYRRIAKLVQPPITPREAEQAVQTLLRLGLIARGRGGTYVQRDAAISTGDVWRSVAIRQFQMDTFDLAKAALDSIDKEERDISTLTMSISSERFDMIRNRITQFRKELIALVTADESPERVYQLSLAFFPLSGKEEER